MRSPLPDSSPLEASLIADQPSPLRNTCVQDSVRSLLRVSMLCRPGHSSRVDEEETIQVFSDVHFDSELDWQAESYMNASRSPTTGPHSTPQDVQPSFTNNNNDSTASTHAEPFRCSETSSHDSVVVLEDPLPVHTSQIDHPDIEANDHALAMLLQYKELQRQNDHAHRPHHRRHRHSRANNPAVRFRVIYCIVSGLLLVALLSTYLAVVLDQRVVGTFFHVVFIISMMIATVLFSHAVIRLVMAYTSQSQRNKRHLQLKNKNSTPRPRSGSSGHSPINGVQERGIPALSSAGSNFVPQTPIQIHFNGDSSSPSATERTQVNGQNDHSSGLGQGLSGSMPDGVLFPPPAYGRWRGSFRADPNLVHWQKVDSERGAKNGTVHETGIANGGGEAPPVYPDDDVQDGIIRQARRVEMVQVNLEGARF